MVAGCDMPGITSVVSRRVAVTTVILHGKRGVRLQQCKKSINRSGLEVAAWDCFGTHVKYGSGRVGGGGGGCSWDFIAAGGTVSSSL